MEKKVTFRTADGIKLSAIATKATRPDETKPPCIVWMHGIAVDKDEYLGFFREGAKSLATAGYSSLRFDFRAHGSSGGTKKDFSVIGQILDAKAAITYAFRAMATELHLVAASFGAPPAIFAALHHPDKVRSLSLIAPVLSYRRTFLEPETDWAREIFNTRGFATLVRTGKLYFDKTFYVGPRLVEEMRVIRPDLALKEVRQQVLVTHGNRDSMVPYSATVDVCRDLPNATVVTIERMDHGHVAEGDDEGLSQASVLNMRLIFDLIRRNIEHGS